MGLSHMRFNQLACASPAAPAVLLCHRLLKCARRKGEARAKAWRVWKAAEVEENKGREARAKLAADGGIFLSVLLF